MKDRWRIVDDTLIWDMAKDKRLPHADHIEMSGRKVSLIVRYAVDADQNLTISREIIWPTLRTRPGDVRGYTRRIYCDEITPRFVIDGQPLILGPVAMISFYGLLRVAYEPVEGFFIERLLYPSENRGCVVEEWGIRDISGARPPRRVELLPESASEVVETATGVYGTYTLRRYIETDHPSTGPSDVLFSVVFDATCEETPSAAAAPPRTLRHPWNTADLRVYPELRGRLDRRDAIQNKNTLTLKTPDRILNGLFRLAKYRAAESVFETAMGLVHSPGGGRYYGGIWANDQAEYSGPLFAYLGETMADQAALNAYRIYARAMKPDYAPVPTSFEMEGTIPFHAGKGGDRGDAAMIASGLTRYLLARGDRTIALELWPAVAWCLEYCRRKTNADGVVASPSDELEGRFPSGDANLSTSCLAYDGLRRAADLARDLANPSDAATYTRRADALETAIERHFGATIDGFETYRYYDGNTTLRSWICLPLVFGLTRRAQGTADALFSPRLWTPDGLATDAGDTVFWDRSTLYALRGAFFAGDTERALAHLTAYSRRRLLGDHVPYPVEAYPEGDQAHLSAESALYCRIFTEGMLGLVPTGLRSFTLTPHLPASWPTLRLTLPAFGHVLRLDITRNADNALRTLVRSGKATLFDATAPSDATHAVVLPDASAAC